METLKLFRGDTIIVKGNVHRDTILVVLSSKDVDDEYAQLSRSARSNLRVLLGDTIFIYPCTDAPYAKRVAILPFADTIEGLTGSLFDSFLKPYFLEAYRPIRQGDIFTCTAGSHRVEFKVIEVDPSPYGIVGRETIIHIEGKPLARHADVSNLVSYRDIGGYETQLTQLREAVELPLLHPQVFIQIGMQPLRGVLLHGRPGTGKTLMIRALVEETGAFYFLVSAPGLLTRKSPGKDLETLFKEAVVMQDKQPVVFVVDNVDFIAPNRESTGGRSDQSLLFALLLSLMDSLNSTSRIIVIATTNDTNYMDPAFRRFGRFGYDIHLDIPTPADRLKILHVLTRNMSLANDVNLEEIATQTFNYVGAELQALCYMASMRQIRSRLIDVDTRDIVIDSEILDSLQVTMEDFVSAKSSITRRVM